MGIKAGENVQVSLAEGQWAGAQATFDEATEGKLTVMAQDVESATGWRFLQNLSKYTSGSTYAKWRAIPLLIFLLCVLPSCSLARAEDRCGAERADAAWRCSAANADANVLVRCRARLRDCESKNGKGTCGDCEAEEFALDASQRLCDAAEERLRQCRARPTSAGGGDVLCESDSDCSAGESCGYTERDVSVRSCCDDKSECTTYPHGWCSRPSRATGVCHAANRGSCKYILKSACRPDW